MKITVEFELDEMTEFQLLHLEEKLRQLGKKDEAELVGNFTDRKFPEQGPPKKH